VRHPSVRQAADRPAPGTPKQPPHPALRGWSSPSRGEGSALAAHLSKHPPGQSSGRDADNNRHLPRVVRDVGTNGGAGADDEDHHRARGKLGWRHSRASFGSGPGGIVGQRRSQSITADRKRPHPSPAIPRNASSNTPAGCPPEIRYFPSTTTAGTALIPRDRHRACSARTAST